MYQPYLSLRQINLNWKMQCWQIWIYQTCYIAGNDGNAAAVLFAGQLSLPCG